MTSAADFSVHSQDLLDFVDASPSPWHAIQTLAERR